MANEIENALKSVATSAAKYVEDVAEMVVETLFIEVKPDGAADFSQAKPVARTTVKLDGDSQTIIPMRQTPAGALEVDSTLFELHQQNVNTAIEYRARILNSLLSALASARGRSV